MLCISWVWIALSLKQVIAFGYVSAKELCSDWTDCHEILKFVRYISPVGFQNVWKYIFYCHSQMAGRLPFSIIYTAWGGCLLLIYHSLCFCPLISKKILSQNSCNTNLNGHSVYCCSSFTYPYKDCCVM